MPGQPNNRAESAAKFKAIVKRGKRKPVTNTEPDVPLYRRAAAKLLNQVAQDVIDGTITPDTIDRNTLQMLLRVAGLDRPTKEDVAKPPALDAKAELQEALDASKQESDKPPPAK